MGDTLKREFSLEPVDTGRVQGTPPFFPGGATPGAGGGGSAGAPDLSGMAGGGGFAPGSIQAGVLSRATGGAVPDPATQGGGAPVTRPSFLQAFLSNLGPALAGGTMSQPGMPFGTGLSGALGGIEEQKRYQQGLQERQQQFQLQQETMRRQMAAQQSTQDLQSAETERLKKLLPGEFEKQQQENEQRQGLIALAKDPQALDNLLKPIVESLGPTTGDERADLEAGRAGVIAKLRKGEFDPTSFTQAAEKVTANRLATTKQDTESGYTDYLNNPTLDPKIKKDRATFVSWKLRQQPAAAFMGNMLPPGQSLDQQAERYWQTGGELPSELGRSPGTVAAIINRAAVLHPEGGLAVNKALRESNRKSLDKFQTMADSIEAFETTAKKNLQQILVAGRNIPDLGSRFANVPVRKIDADMIGTKEMATFRTALLSGRTEAMRTINSATASGVLTESDKEEGKKILDGDLPFPAMEASIMQLLKDVDNRKTSNDMQIKDIQRRLGAKGAADSGAEAEPTTKRRVIDITIPK
jgi:hypothetical protein